MFVFINGFNRVYYHPFRNLKSMNRKLLALIFIGFSTYILSQEITTITDLKKELQNEVVDTTKVSLNLMIADSYLKINKDSAFFYFNKGLGLANKIDSKRQIAQLLYKIGVAYENQSNFEKAIKYYLEAVSIFDTLNNTAKVAGIYSYVAYSYSQLYIEDKAIEYYLKSLQAHKDIGDELGIAMIYLSFGELFYSKENFIQAKKYFKDALSIYIKLDDKNGISVCYTNLGNGTADSGDNEAGLAYYNKSIIIQEKINDQFGIGINYNNIGDCNIQLKKYDVALDYFSKSLSIAEKLNEKSLVSIVLLNISDVKIKLKQYFKAIQYAEKSLKITEEIGDLENQAENLIILAAAHESLGIISKSNDYNKKYIVIKDSLTTIDKTNKVKLFQALNNLEKSHHTINDLSSKHEITRLKYEDNRKFIYFLIGAVLLFGFFVVLLILQQTAKKKAYNLLEYKNHQINKMNEKIQIQRDGLKQLNKTKDIFFSIIAHDLRNPFNSIEGFTELLIENVHEYSEEKRLKFLKIIKGSSSKASILLDNLLIWANSQSGNLDFNPQKIDLKQEVSDVISLLEIQAVNKDIKILNNVVHNVFVDADQNMLAAVLRNLISNAIKFTNLKGEIQILSAITNDFVEISVKDNGIGISQFDIDNLFSIEVKSSNVGTANEQGSGLGLILCKDFVEKHGCKLWVESAINEGSEFKFTMPIAVN